MNYFFPMVISDEMQVNLKCADRLHLCPSLEISIFHSSKITKNTYNTIFIINQAYLSHSVCIYKLNMFDISFFIE